VSLQSDVFQEMAAFFANGPSPDEIVAFQASQNLTDRFYALLEEGKRRKLSEEEERDLDSVEVMQHFILHTKAEARRKLRQQAS
jgi:hypothetical protein